MMLYYLLTFIFVFISCIGKVSAHHNPTFGFTGTAGPIITNPASTIPKGHWGVGIRTEYTNFNELSNAGVKYFAKKRQFTHSTSYFLSPALGVAYGVTDNFTFAFRVPYNVQGGIVDGTLIQPSTNFSETLRHHTQSIPNGATKPALVRRGTSDGLGDLTLFTQYRFLNLKDKAFEAAFLSGITIPSGLAHVKDKVGKRFGPDHQPSKRSFDPLVGLSISKRFGHKLSFDSNYLFTKAVKGIQGFDAGDLHNYNVALSYRFLEQHIDHHDQDKEPHDHSHTHSDEHLDHHDHHEEQHNHSHTHSDEHHDHHDHHEEPDDHSHLHEHFYGAPIEEHKFSHSHEHPHKWYSIFGADAILELNGEWRQKQVFGTRQPFGFTDEDSGGSIIYISPGVRLAIGDNWATYVSLGLPVIQDQNGDCQKTDFRMLFGVSRSF